MKRINFITVTLSLIGLAGAAKIFQGDCSDEKSLCEQLCIKSSSVTYQCKCWSGHNLLDDGFSCKADTKTQYEHPNERTINVQVLDEDKEKLKPIRFTGSNYARFPITEDTYLETNITLQFRIEQDQDGVILFAGQLLGDDFLAITREGPNIILRHDCGEGTIEDMYHAKDLIPGPWHEINVWRKNCNRVEMKLDQGHRLVDDANEFMNFKGITIDEGVFLGGAPRHIEFLREKTGTTHGFTGCVRKLIINGHVLLDTKDGINKAMDQSDFEYCSDHVARAPPPIHDVTLIKAFDLTREGFPEITDRELSSRMSESTPKTTTTTTKAPMVKVPAQEEYVKIAHFDGSSWLTIAGPEDIQQYLHFSVQFKTEESDGIIFYWHAGDRFILVTLENGFVRIYASLGGDVVDVSSRMVVSLFRWHKLEVWRSGRGILFKLDHHPYIEAFLRIDTFEHNTGTFYIGGGHVASISHVTQNFVGCLKHVKVNGNVIPIMVLPSQNITKCSTDPCASAGCPAGCLDQHYDHVCLCKWPSKGDKCQYASNEGISAMRFSGHSYVEIDREEVLNHITGESLDINVDIKMDNNTQSLDQVILSVGDVTQEDDFLYLAVDQHNQVVFSINLGSGSVELVHPHVIQSEKWTTIKVTRNQRKVELTVQNQDPIHAVLPEGSEQLNVYYSMFMGGEPESRLITQYPRSTGYRGCMISLRVADTIINHPKQVKQAINIEDCRD